MHAQKTFTTTGTGQLTKKPLDIPCYYEDTAMLIKLKY